MHDLRLLREQPDALRDGVRRRGALDTLAGDLDRAIALERERRESITQVEELLAARTAVSATVAAAKRNRDEAKAQSLMAEGRDIGDRHTSSDSAGDTFESNRSAEKASATRAIRVPWWRIRRTVPSDCGSRY